MPQVILRPYLLQFLNRRTRGSKVVRRNLLLLTVAFLITLSIYAVFRMILGSVSGEKLLAELIATKLIELLFYSFFLLQLFSCTIAAIGNIYNAENMSLLLSAPINNRRLFLAKFFETLFETGAMLVIFITPIGLAFINSLEVYSGFLPVAAALIFVLLLIPCGLGVITATAFVAVSATLWKRGGLLIGCLLTAFCWLLFRLFDLLSSLKIERGGNAIVELIGLFENPNPIWSPARWASDILNSYISGTGSQLREKTFLLAFLTIASISLAFLVFDFFMFRVRSASISQADTQSSKVKSSNSDRIRRFLERFAYILPIPQQTRAIMLKDTTSLIRDKAQALQLLMYGGIAVAYLLLLTFMSKALDIAPEGMRAWLALLSTLNILFAGFIVTAIMTRLVYPAISLEGKAFWILDCAPISISEILKSKFWCWLPLTTAISSSLLLLGVSLTSPSIPVILFTLVTAISISVGCTGLAVGIGAAFASFEWESPNQISAGFGTLVLLLTSLSFVLGISLLAGISLFILNVPESWNYFGQLSTLSALLISCIAIPSISLGVESLAKKRGARALATTSSL